MTTAPFDRAPDFAAFATAIFGAFATETGLLGPTLVEHRASWFEVRFGGDAAALRVDWDGLENLCVGYIIRVAPIHGSSERFEDFPPGVEPDRHGLRSRLVFAWDMEGGSRDELARILGREVEYLRRYWTGILRGREWPPRNYPK